MAAVLSITAVAAAQRPEKASLRQGQQKTLLARRLTIRFDSVEEDSRCPEAVNCVWAGVARIKIQVRKNGKPFQVFELNTNQQDKPAVFEDREIRLIALNPYPKAGDTAKDIVYTATISIEKVRK